MCVTCDIPGGDGVASEVVDGGGIIEKKTKTNNPLGYHLAPLLMSPFCSYSLVGPLCKKELYLQSSYSKVIVCVIDV